MSELKRWYQYVETADDAGRVKVEPAMCLAPKRDRAVNSAAWVIPLSVAHRYLEPEYMFRRTMEIIERLDLGLVTTRRMADIAELIVSGLDDLVRMPPHERRREVIGEGVCEIGGRRRGFEILN